MGIYDRDELIAHELSHAGRMMYEEPKFEEVLAYRSSHSSFRRFFGPIIQSSYESMIFVLVLLFVIVADFYSLINGEGAFSHLAFIGRLMLLAMVGYGLIRLYVRQRQYHKSKMNLREALLNNSNADAVIYRLTDKEIIQFGSMSPQEIKKYAQEQSTQTMRWKNIYAAYF